MSILDSQAREGVLKDERRTGNIERPTSNEKQTSKQLFFQIISLFLHLSPLNIRCWTFDVRRLLCSTGALVCVPIRLGTHQQEIGIGKINKKDPPKSRGIFFILFPGVSNNYPAMASFLKCLFVRIIQKS